MTGIESTSIWDKLEISEFKQLGLGEYSCTGIEYFELIFYAVQLIHKQFIFGLPFYSILIILSMHFICAIFFINTAMLVVGFQEITLQLQMSNESNLLELFIAPLSLIIP